MVIRLVLAAAVLVGLAPTSFAADCPAADRKPQVQIIVDDGTVSYDFTRTRAQMAEVPHELGVAAPNHGREPQGLTFNKVTIAVSTELRYRDIGRGDRCIYPGRIVLTVSSQQRVFVDIHYREGSCERQAVLDHEGEHVRINRAAVHAHEDALHRAIEALVAAHPYYVVPSTRPSETTYIAPIQEQVKPVLRVMRNDADTRHAALDSPASHAATREKCHHW